MSRMLSVPEKVVMMRVSKVFVVSGHVARSRRPHQALLLMARERRLIQQRRAWSRHKHEQNPLEYSSASSATPCVQCPSRSWCGVDAGDDQGRIGDPAPRAEAARTWALEAH